MKRIENRKSIIVTPRKADKEQRRCNESTGMKYKSEMNTGMKVTVTRNSQGQIIIFIKHKTM